MIQQSWLIALLIAATFTLSGQAKFYAKADASKILEGSYVTVDFVLENAEGTQPANLNFGKLKVVSGPSTQTSVSIVNGKRTSSITYSYTLLGEKPGTYTIAPASIKVGKNNLTSQALTVQVIKAEKKSTKAGQEDYYVQIVASDSTAYIGQQVILDYMLYTKVDVRQYNILNESEYDGFFAQELSKPNQFERQIIGGTEYFVKSLKRIALFPQQVGTYPINDINMTLGIATGQKRGFFQNIMQQNVRASGLTLQVIDLPEGAPPSFSGAVGKYGARVTTNKQSLTTDDAIQITMTVQGNGDAKYVQAPKLILPDGLELYDPNTIQDETKDVNGAMRHTKVFEYLIVAQKPGRYTIQPDFAYLDTETNEYVVISQPTFTYNVLKGSGNANKVVETEEVVTLGPISETTVLRSQSGMFFGSGLYFALLGMLGGGIVGLYGYRRKLERSGAFDALVQRKKKAKLKVIRELDAELSKIDQSNSKARVELLSRKFRDYITQKFAVKDIEFTDKEIVTMLQEKEIDTATTEAVQTFLSQSQMAIYAGVSVDKQASMYDSVVSILDAIESQVEANPQS